MTTSSARSRARAICTCSSRARTASNRRTNACGVLSWFMTVSFCRMFRGFADFEKFVSDSGSSAVGDESFHEQNSQENKDDPVPEFIVTQVAGQGERRPAAGPRRRVFFMQRQLKSVGELVGG